MNEVSGESTTSFRDAWAAKIAWGSHAQQHPCTCSIADGASACRVGVPLYINYMRLANICNGILGDEARMSVTDRCEWCRKDGCTPENDAECPCPHHAESGSSSPLPQEEP